MSTVYDRFLLLVPASGLILDAGCGSGRDSKAFLTQGYRVRAFDASPQLAQLASEYIGRPVAVQSFQELTDERCYDGIWACASLLHLPEVEIPDALQKLWAALKPGGVLYLSFKVGTGEREHQGRHFTDASETRLKNWLTGLSDINHSELWITADQRPNRTEEWLNALVVKNSVHVDKLIAGGNDPFLPHLSTAIVRASEIDMAVAFIKATGLKLLLSDLYASLDGHAEVRPEAARIRILTSDYLDVTDPEALRLLMLLQERGAQVRVYESKGGSFHLKAYLFAYWDDRSKQQGQAFIGSSNISRQALQTGLEWNYRIDHPGDPGYFEARARFEELFASPQAQPLTDAWIEQYEKRRMPLPRAIAPGSLEQEPAPQPHAIQVQALEALHDTRAEGYSRGLVVLATGLGKTWLAAFDAHQCGARRILFVAHREEILQQAAQTFLRVRPTAKIGFYMGQHRDVEVDVLCASVQTLSRNAHLERFSPDHFDYMVIDEFHHASASTYRRLLNYFRPRFLLGLTATPDRTDQSDILSLCDDNLVFSYPLFEGINSKLLAPFHYFGIFDETINYREIPWRNGRFDPNSLSNKLATLGRARHALTQWHARAQQRTLAFCVSVQHADFMAEQFLKAGVAAAAVYAGSPLSRADALERLRDKRLAVIFSVDLFNEGVDLPEIDTVMLLRPTESKILFLQQLGRGLRKTNGKDKLVVLDFVGNHQSFLHKPQALFGVGTSYRQLAEFARKIEQQRLNLPDGCYANYDLQLIEFLKSLDGDGIEKEYAALKEGLSRRPSLSEFFRAGSSVQRMRKQYGNWFGLVTAQGDLEEAAVKVVASYRAFLREVETTSMTRSFKMVLLEAMLELGGLRKPLSLSLLAERSWQILQRRRPLLRDISIQTQALEDGTSAAWQRYWFDNPVNAWIGGNRVKDENAFFHLADGCFAPLFTVPQSEQEILATLVQELVDYRLAAYEARQQLKDDGAKVVPLSKPATNAIELAFFPNLKIACGHFKTGFTDAEEYRSLAPRFGELYPERHFIARASGNSMNGGESPIRDGDYLLLERVLPTEASRKRIRSWRWNEKIRRTMRINTCYAC